MLDVQTVSIVVASASVVAAVIYYSLVVRHQSRQIQHQTTMIQHQTTLRQTDLILRLQDTFANWQLTQSFETLMSMRFKDIDEYRKKYLPKQQEGARGNWSPEVRAMVRLARFFDTVGILLHRKLIDIEMVDELFGTSIKMAWEKYAPIAEWRRKQPIGYPTFVKHWECLYNEVKKRESPLTAQTA